MHYRLTPKMWRKTKNDMKFRVLQIFRKPLLNEAKYLPEQTTGTDAIGRVSDLLAVAESRHSPARVG